MCFRSESTAPGKNVVGNMYRKNNAYSSEKTQDFLAQFFIAHEKIVNSIYWDEEYWIKRIKTLLKEKSSIVLIIS